MRQSGRSMVFDVNNDSTAIKVQSALASGMCYGARGKSRLAASTDAKAETTVLSTLITIVYDQPVSHNTRD
jgi:hypothetical protein